MISRLKKTIRYPSQILRYIDFMFGSLRSSIEYNSKSYISILSKTSNPKKIEIGRHSRVQPFTVLKPQNSGITIGDHCTIHEFGFLAGNISIGDDVRIAQKVSMHSFNHNISKDEKIREQSLEHGKITIRDDVWIGCDVTILKDVEIGEGAVIGAGSIVTSDVEPYTVVAGNPARQIDTRN